MINVMCGFDTTNKDVSITFIFWGEGISLDRKTFYIVLCTLIYQKGFKYSVMFYCRNLQ